MNPRERLMTALRRGTPDRVPVCTHELVGFNTAAFENRDPSYRTLMDLIREKTDCVAMWNPQSDNTLVESAHPCPTTSETVREGNTTVTRTRLETPAGPLTSTRSVVDGIHTVWHTEHWCKSTDDVDRALSVPYVPVTYDFSDFDRIRGEVGDNGIIMASIADPLLAAADLMDFADFTIWAAMDTDHFASTVERLHARIMENLRRMLAGGLVDLYRIVGPEYATPPFLPPELFRRFVVPYVAEMVELIHSHGAMVRLHCHGRIGQVLEMMLDTGADALDPCEAPPSGDVALDEVKRRVGHRMCVFGNIQLNTLEGGTERDVEDAVRRCMAEAKEGGGYVIMPTAAPINTPLSAQTERNYRVFIDTALELGAY